MCVAEAPDGIISGPFLFDGKGKLFFTTYSGSNQRAHLLDTKSCAMIWKSATFGAGSIAAPRTGTLRVGKALLRLSESCVPRRK